MRRTVIIMQLAFLLQAAWGSAPFQNNVLINFQASGPVNLMTGQNASVCATNLDNSPVAVLIALLQPDNGSVLGVQQQQLQPGGGSCLDLVRTQQPKGPAQGNVIGFVVANAHLTELGAVVQDRP